MKYSQFDKILYMGFVVIASLTFIFVILIVFIVHWIKKRKSPITEMTSKHLFDINITFFMSQNVSNNWLLFRIFVQTNRYDHSSHFDLARSNIISFLSIHLSIRLSMATNEWQTGHA